MKTKNLIILAVILVVCLPITNVYAFEQGNMSINGIESFLSGFVEFVIDLFSGVISGIVDFFGNLFSLFLLTI